MNPDCLPPTIETADIDWRGGEPRCKRFGDIYFSRHNGLEEARHVFLEGNFLAQRFARVPEAGHFVVAEAGFGTGLNFLACWQLWKAVNSEPHASLHYLSVERYPLKRQDLARALALWPELADLANELLNQYPPVTCGAHRLVLAGGRLRLTLYFGDIGAAWEQLEFTADAWFLDGFAPAKNPAIWSRQIILAMAKKSRSGTSLATFTAVGEVRRQLLAAGFSMRKTRGFGHKRHMLVGEFSDTGGPCKSSPASYAEPVADSVPPTQRNGVGIVGAGIAGTLLARNLAERGFKVTLIDQADSVASAASGNSQGALYVKLGVDFNVQAELALSCLLFSHRFYDQFKGRGWHPTGLIQLAYSASEADRQERFLIRNQYPEEILSAVGADKASELAGIPIPHSGLWFPNNGWLQPEEICRQLSRHQNIKCQFGRQVTALQTGQDGWKLIGAGGEATNNADTVFDRVVLCAGHKTPELIPLAGEYRIKPIRGQITEVPENHLRSPALVICGPGYVNPAHNGRSLVGATFDLHNLSTQTSECSNHQNLTMLSDLLPGSVNPYALAEISGDCEGRVAFRCTTHDYQPIAGPMLTRDGEHLNGLYLFSGLGSKGLTYSSLLAEYLGDLISGQPSCLPRHLAKRVQTQRCHRPKPSKSEGTTADVDSCQ